MREYMYVLHVCILSFWWYKLGYVVSYTYRSEERLDARSQCIGEDPGLNIILIDVGRVWSRYVTKE